MWSDQQHSPFHSAAPASQLSGVAPHKYQQPSKVQRFPQYSYRDPEGRQSMDALNKAIICLRSTVETNRQETSEVWTCGAQGSFGWNANVTLGIQHLETTYLLIFHDLIVNILLSANWKSKLHKLQQHKQTKKRTSPTYIGPPAA